MLDEKLKRHLSYLSKTELETILFNYYKFIVDKLESLKKENKGFKEQNMDLLANKTQEEIDFVRLELQWLENYLVEKVD